MTDVSFVPADPTTFREPLLALNLEYVGWVLAQIEANFGLTPESLLGMSVAEYVPTVIDKVCGDPPPRGVFYLLNIDGAWAGMGGLRPLAERGGERVAEIKRIYVRPPFRGRNLGETLLRRLIADAQSFGYDRLTLDTGPFMGSAQRLYESLGFVDCAAYDGVEVPETLHEHWRFLERRLSLSD